MKISIVFIINGEIIRDNFFVLKMEAKF